MRRERLFPLILILLSCATTLVRAQGTYTAASSAESDVNAVINGPAHFAVNGDVIQIPCSPATSTWTATITVTASITISGQGATPNTGTSTFGAGTNCITLIDNNTNGPLFYLAPTYASTNNVTTLQNLNIDPVSTSTALWSPIDVIGTATASGFPQVRIDNVIFGNSIQWNEGGNSSNAAWMIRHDDVVGVFDHNTLPNGSTVEFYSANFSAWLGVGQYGDNSWAQPDSYGTANNIFAENNLLYVNMEVNDCEIADSTFSNKGGCRVVNRYNQVYCANCFQVVSVHGLDTSGRPRSGRHTESYQNTVSCTTGACQDLCSYRGGTGLCWGNTATVQGSAFWNQVFDVAVYRTVYNNAPFGACGGLNSLDSWDTNDNTVYYSGTITSTSNGNQTMTDTSENWSSNQFIPNGAPYSVNDTTHSFTAEISSNTANSLTMKGSIPEQANNFSPGDNYQIIRSTVCADQAGRGAGNYISGTSPSPSSALNEALDPIYEWNNSMQKAASNFSTATGRVIANRDYYTTNTKGSPIEQASPTTPFNGSTTCNAGSGNYTCGIGFGTLANRPAACSVQVGYFATDTNTLYECLTANTWTASYTPYTYPHPLASADPLPSPPQNLNAQVD
jgi:hypothetical protein